jgi:hypothetical protein
MEKKTVVVDINTDDKIEGDDWDFTVNVQAINNYLSANNATGNYSCFIDRLEVEVDAETAIEHLEIRAIGLQTDNKFRPTDEGQHNLQKSNVLCRANFRGVNYITVERSFVGNVSLPFQDNLRFKLYDYTDSEPIVAGSFETHMRLIFKAQEYKQKK